MREGRIVERPENYTIDAELGRLHIDVFEIKEGSKKVFSTRKDVLPETGSREAYPTPCFQEVVVFFPCHETFRQSEATINRVWWREEKTDRIQFRTIANMVEREGQLIAEQIGKKAERILTSNGFNTDGKLTDCEKAFQPEGSEAFLPPERICKMIEEREYRKIHKNDRLTSANCMKRLRIQLKSKLIFRLMMSVAKNKKLRAERRILRLRKKEKWCITL